MVATLARSLSVDSSLNFFKEKMHFLYFMLGSFVLTVSQIASTTVDLSMCLPSHDTA